MSTNITAPFPLFVGLDGLPLNDGYVYIGLENQNPETAPAAVYWDSALTIPAVQPLRTRSGYILRSGAAANIYTDGNFSIAVRDVSSRLVFSRASVTDLSSILAELSGAGLVGFGPSESYGVGSVGSAVQDGRVNIMWFLTDAQRADVKARTASIDLTSVMQAVHALGRLVYYPAGVYKFSRLSSAITGGGMVGDGQTQTILLSNDTSSGNLFTFNGASPGGIGNQVVVQDIQIQGALSGSDPAKSGGAAIAISPASGENAYSYFSNVTITFVPIGIDFVAASGWKIIGCSFLSYNVAGVQVANTNSFDSGDSAIVGCKFNNPYTTGSGIWQKSSGGLKIVGNKFLGGARGYTMNLEGSTSVLLVQNNSFENMVQQDMVFSRGASGTNFVNVCITGNEFSVGGVAISTDNSGFLSQVNISANQINMGATGSNACIALNNVTDGILSANLIKGNGGLGSSAINLIDCTNVKIGVNAYSNLPNPISVSGGTGCTIDLQPQSGSVITATTGWIAYGSQFLSPLQTVTFAVPFLVTPSINDARVSTIAANGELGAVVVSVSKTQLQFRVISNTTSIAAQAAWQVMGVL